MNEAEETAYTEGHRAAWTAILSEALRQLGYAYDQAGTWMIEREAAVAALRDVCREHGDNDWDGTLHLADVINKHLGRHLSD